MISVNRCVVRYLAEGIEGLPIKKGRGRKAILSSEEDLETVRLAVAENRQRIGLVQAQLQKELRKEFSTLTLKRFLKSIVVDTSASADR
jgi:transposase